METRKYTTIDRTGWPSGEWDGEPDKMQWPDADTGLPCIAKRHPLGGHWCGYVGVADGHPLFGKGYEDAADIEAHWGLTYANACEQNVAESTGICHVPGPGEPDHVWWFGFDCAHSGDASPLDAQRGWCHDGNKYRTLAYVRNECKKIARQLMAVDK